MSYLSIIILPGLEETLEDIRLLKLPDHRQSRGRSATKGDILYIVLSNSCIALLIRSLRSQPNIGEGASVQDVGAVSTEILLLEAEYLLVAQRRLLPPNQKELDRRTRLAGHTGVQIAIVAQGRRYVATVGAAVAHAAGSAAAAGGAAGARVSITIDHKRLIEIHDHRLPELLALFALQDQRTLAEQCPHRLGHLPSITGAALSTPHPHMTRLDHVAIFGADGRERSLLHGLGIVAGVPIHLQEERLQHGVRLEVAAVEHLTALAAHDDQLPLEDLQEVWRLVELIKLDEHARLLEGLKTGGCELVGSGDRFRRGLRSVPLVDDGLDSHGSKIRGDDGGALRMKNHLHIRYCFLSG